nr:MAG TPA: hypothetical protein [Caudoviricetes sp.]
MKVHLQEVILKLVTIIFILNYQMLMVMKQTLLQNQD